MTMKVITLSDPEFSDACAALYDKAVASGFTPDILVGIASGGWHVALRMPAPRRMAVTKRRNAAGAKKRFLPALLRRLPRRVNDLLRIAESRLYGLKARIRPPRPSHVCLPYELTDALNEHPDARLLIADDAVDSGATLLSVRDAIQRAAPQAMIKTAVITVTRPHALISPDYTLYPQGTIVRFPWAPDC